MSRELSENGKYELLKMVNYTKLLLLANHAKAQKLRHMHYTFRLKVHGHFIYVNFYLCICICICKIHFVYVLFLACV